MCSQHYHRYYPTYYIKSDGEIDIAYVDKEHFWPVEVKWTNQIRAEELKTLAKYPKAKLLTKTPQIGNIYDIRSEPIVLGLLILATIKQL